MDSGSVCTIINKSLANTVVSECDRSYWVQSPELHDLKTFSNDIIKIIGVTNTSIRCNDWTATGVDVTVVEDGHRPIIGRDLFSKLDFSLTQLKQVANIDQNQCLIKKKIAFGFRVSSQESVNLLNTQSNPHSTNNLHLLIKNDDESQLIYNH